MLTTLSAILITILMAIGTAIMFVVGFIMILIPQIAVLCYQVYNAIKAIIQA